MNKASLVKVEVKTNSKGVTYSIMKETDVLGNDRQYGVWKLCINYKAGRDVKTWRYVERDMSLEAAQKMFAKKTK